MRLLPVCLIAGLLATVSMPIVSLPARAQVPPHAWLFGSWTGGLFPVPAGMTAQMCLSQPVVIFTRDVVLRATLVDQVYHQRVIETLRATPHEIDLRFAPGIDPLAVLGSGLLGTEAPRPQSGFGCESPDVLHIQRRGENEIMFQGCADFPEPLIRCPAR